MMICFDLTKARSMEAVKRWILAINKNCDENVAMVLVGTKSDMVAERAVSMQDA